MFLDKISMLFKKFIYRLPELTLMVPICVIMVWLSIGTVEQELPFVTDDKFTFSSVLKMARAEKENVDAHDVIILSGVPGVANSHSLLILYGFNDIINIISSHDEHGNIAKVCPRILHILFNSGISENLTFCIRELDAWAHSVSVPKVQFIKIHEVVFSIWGYKIIGGAHSWVIITAVFFVYYDMFMLEVMSMAAKEERILRANKCYKQANVINNVMRRWATCTELVVCLLIAFIASSFSVFVLFSRDVFYYGTYVNVGLVVICVVRMYRNLKAYYIIRNWKDLAKYELPFYIKIKLQDNWRDAYLFFSDFVLDVTCMWLIFGNIILIFVRVWEIMSVLYFSG